MLGIGTLMAVLAGLIYGLAIGDIPRGLGQALVGLATVTPWPWSGRQSAGAE